MAESRKASFVVLIIARSCEGPFYYIDTKALLESTPLVKFMRNYNQGSSGVFSKSSLVTILMTSLISCLTLKLYLNLLVYDRDILESFSDVLGNLWQSSKLKKMYGDVRQTLGQLLKNLRKSSENRQKCRHLIVFLYNKQNNTWLPVGRYYSSRSQVIY